MNCPRCNVELKKVSVGGIDVDFCDTCEGLWFDADELDRVYGVYGEKLGGTAISKSIEGVLRTGEKEGQNELSCPRCGGVLERKAFDADLHVLVDGCTAGCGIWLDDGELGAIAQHLAKKNALDSPETQHEIMKKLIQIQREADEREEKMIDNMVKTDNSPGLFRGVGVLLQGIYRGLYKIGV